MKTNTINSLSELRQFGIDVLTGESCALSRRLLCDVTTEGKNLVMKAFGVPDISLPQDWNGGDAVGSILLDRETLQTICILALFENKECLEVWEDEVGRFYGMGEERLNAYEENKKWQSFDSWRKYRIPSRSVGGRNVHQMSGRAS